MQRYQNFRRSVDNLREALDVTAPSKLERCYELAWKTVQDYLREQGIRDVVGPKAVIQQAFAEGILSDGDAWAALHRARNESSHLYDETTAREIEQQIRVRFFDLLTALEQRLRNVLG